MPAGACQVLTNWRVRERSADSRYRSASRSSLYQHRHIGARLEQRPHPTRTKFSRFFSTLESWFSSDQPLKVFSRSGAFVEEGNRVHSGRRTDAACDIGRTGTRNGVSRDDLQQEEDRNRFSSLTTLIVAGPVRERRGGDIDMIPTAFAPSFRSRPIADSVATFVCIGLGAPAAAQLNDASGAKDNPASSATKVHHHRLRLPQVQRL